MEYINNYFPKREMRPGEFYDMFTNRHYITDPIID